MLFSERPPIFPIIVICVVVHDDLGWKTEQHVIIGFGELTAVD